MPEEWFTGELEKRVGEMVWVKVTKIKGKPPGFQVEGRYDATLPVLKSIYPGRSGKVSQAIRNLEDEEIIRCEIVSVDSRNRSIHLKMGAGLGDRRQVSQKLSYRGSEYSGG